MLHRMCPNWNRLITRTFSKDKTPANNNKRSEIIANDMKCSFPPVSTYFVSMRTLFKNPYSEVYFYNYNLAEKSAFKLDG